MIVSYYYITYFSVLFWSYFLCLIKRWIAFEQNQFICYDDVKIVWWNSIVFLLIELFDFYYFFLEGVILYLPFLFCLQSVTQYHHYSRYILINKIQENNYIVILKEVIISIVSRKKHTKNLFSQDFQHFSIYDVLSKYLSNS